MTPQQVIRNYRAMAGLYTLSASLIWGVNTLFLLDAGLDIFGVFIANAAFTAGMFLFEIPTGVVADTLGRRTSFLRSLTGSTKKSTGVRDLNRNGEGQTRSSLFAMALRRFQTFFSGRLVLDVTRASRQNSG